MSSHLQAVQYNRLSIPNPVAGVPIQAACWSNPHLPKIGYAVIGHGLDDDRNHPVVLGLARGLSARGIEVYAFDSAAHGQDRRDVGWLRGSTMADDFGVVVQWLRNELVRKRLDEAKIIEIGHSRSFPNILAGRSIDPVTLKPVLGAPTGSRGHDALISVDGSHSDCNRAKSPNWSKGDYEPELVRGRAVPKAFLESCCVDDSGELAGMQSCPALVVVAGANPFLREYTSKYSEQLAGQVELRPIEGADHNFTDPQSLVELQTVVGGWAVQLLTRTPQPALAGGGVGIV